MLIALDYDGTYTRDMALWDRFIDDAIRNRHKVICVTMRFDNDIEAPPVMSTIGKKCDVVFTGRNAKKDFLDKIGVFPDIWIDDNPMWIYTDG